MNANRKLTKTIKGRTIKDASQNGSILKIAFDDNSMMEIKTSDGANLKTTELVGLSVDNVQQQDTRLRLIGANNKQADIPLDEASSSVMLRDKNNTLEYAD